jgi:channel protein (hemolysin III family)
MNQALHALLINSANDAAVAIAEHIGGSVEGFSAMMNEEAVLLGATNSHFMNPHGLTENEHYVTAYDMYLMMNAAMQYELFNEIIHMSEYSTVYYDNNDQEKEMSFKSTNLFFQGDYSAPDKITVIGGKTGINLLAIVWTVGILGIIFKLCWVTCPKWLSSVMYIAMGWLCVLAFTPIVNSMTKEGFFWLVFGGIIYTVGGVLYAIKTPRVKAFNQRHKYFGTHEIFHLFVMAGSLCHFVLIYNYIV